jgi:hypothetical protein
MASHNHVAHAWANQNGRGNRAKGFNMWYDGDTIYSYGTHFPIARIVPCDNGIAPRCILFTTENRSISTAKHKTITWRACQGDRVFTVPNVEARCEADHLANHANYVVRARASFDKAKQARVYGDFHLREAAAAIGSANLYATWFNLPVEQIDVAQFDAAWAQVAARTAERRADAERRQRIAQRERDRANHEKLCEWLKGSDIYPPHTARPYVRIRGDVVQTSWGAEVPLAAAVKVYKMARICRRMHNPLVMPADDDHMVGGYRLNSIDAVGTVRIGCHVLGFRMMQRVAKAAGIDVA